jgi:polysaccharide biosynthesis protein PslG
MTKLALLAALAAAVALAVPTVSVASPNVRYGVQDDAYLAAGPTLETNLATLDQLGAKLVRYMVNWRQIAAEKPRHPADPDDPAYNWTNMDAVLGGLHAHRITVLLTLYRVPSWANGGRGSSGVPTSKNSLAAFAVAVAKRYPWVRLWEIWNEPNLRTFLNPNSPRLYVRRLLNPTYDALVALNPLNRVAGGATSPRSTKTGLSPVKFMRGMREAHARLDAYSHHPYPVTRGERPFGFARGVCRFCTGVLTLANLPALITEVRRNFGAKRIWLTEYGYQTNESDPLGVSPNLQAKYVADSALRVRGAPLVDVLIQFLVQDESRRNGWQSGLVSPSGIPKPAFNSFMLPIAQSGRRGHRTTIWGQVRPSTGRRPYQLQRLVHGRWAHVGVPALTDARGSYTRVVWAARGTRFRTVWLGTMTSSRPIVIR